VARLSLVGYLLSHHVDEEAQGFAADVPANHGRHPMLYSAIVKKRIRQSFDQVNNHE
jgi:hypothetical protein